MSDPVFFLRPMRLSLAEIVASTGAGAAADADLSPVIGGAAPLDDAAPGDIAFFGQGETIGRLESTRASACFVTQRDVPHVPSATVALVTEDPEGAFALALARIFPGGVRSGSLFATAGVNPGASIHPEARLEPGVIVDPGAVIGPRAEIGSGSVIGANSVIGPDVRIGRDCAIGAQVTIVRALIGNRVIMHPGARVGQAGGRFGAHAAPQIGRVIIQDGVEIGANATIDRGSSRDTVIGEGAAIGNLVEIAANVTIGRECHILSQACICDSTQLGDFVAVASQAVIAGHLRIGARANVSARSGVVADMPPGSRFGGSPSRPVAKAPTDADRD